MANRFTFPRETALDANGNPLAGAKLYFYESGTTKPADSFADEALTIANANPVVADSAGRFGDIFLQAIDYKVVLKDAADVTVWTADPVSGTVIATGDKFIPSQQSPADMTALVGPGTIWDAVPKTRLVLAAQTTALITAPLTNPRNDIVYIDRVSGVVGTQTGAEAATPVDPTIPDGKQPVARVRLATATIQIDASLIDDIRELELLGAGTAAVRNTGTAAGQIPLMDAAGYPAADGRQITNVDVPRGYIDGLVLSNNATDAGNDIDIAPGIARDGANAANLDLPAVLTKQLDAVWAVGTNAGGLGEAAVFADNITVSFDNATSKILGVSLFATVAVGDRLIVSGSVSNNGVFTVTARTNDDATLTPAPTTEAAGAAITVHIVKANTWYHVWLIRRSDTGVVDALFSTSATAPTLPTGYDQKRRVGAVLTDGAGNIIGFRQIGDRFFWKQRTEEINIAGAIASVRTAITMTVPSGVVVVAIVSGMLRITAEEHVLFLSPNDTDVTPTAVLSDLSSRTALTQADSVEVARETDTSSRIYYRSAGGGAVEVFTATTVGWIDPRGRNA